MATIKRSPFKMSFRNVQGPKMQTVERPAHETLKSDLSKQIELQQLELKRTALQEQQKKFSPEYQKQLQAEKRQEEWMKGNQKTAEERRRHEQSLETAKRKKELDTEKYLANKKADVLVKRQLELEKQQTYKDIFKKYEPTQTQEASTAFGRIGQKFSKGYKDITGITQGEERSRQAALAQELQQQVAAEKGQVPDYLSQAERDALTAAQGGVIQKPRYTSVLPVSGLAQYGQTISKNIGFQGTPSYDVQNLNRQAGSYLGTDVFNVANPSLPSYAQQAEKARVLTSSSSTPGSYRSPLDVVRDSTGIGMTQPQTPTNKVLEMTSQGSSMSMMSPDMKIRQMTGMSQPQYYQQQFEIGMPINPMNVQYQQPMIQQRTIDPYQQQMMQEMRQQAAMQRQQQRSVEDQIVRQKVQSMNSIGSGVNVGMAGGVNLNKSYATMGQSQEYVPSPREAGVTTPASRPVTYRRGAYQKHQ